jgi:hypothetical protein
MATATEVLQMLRPEGGWIMHDNDYDKIQWLECAPVSRTDFDAGFAQYDVWKAEQEEAKRAAKAAAEAKLAALGLTPEDLKALLS